MHGIRPWASSVCLLVSLAVFASSGHAHPVPKRFHDRLITVHLTPEAVRVEYHLEADAWTVVYVDLPAVDDQVDLPKLTQPKEFYEAYTRVYAPILANNLAATLDGKPLTFRCTKYGWQDKDSIWCDYVFEAAWQPAADARGAFTFREGNYETESGQIKLFLVADPGVVLLEKTEPDEALKNRPATQLLRGDDAKLRKAAAVFTLTAPAGEARATVPSPGPDKPTAEGGKEAEPAAPAGAPRQSSSLFNLLLDTRQGFVALLLAATLFGAAHALTPGHGKTLVAAYLVGERGTARHAVLLGLVTTLTHTGAVIVLALVAGWFLPQAQVALALAAGLMVVVLGLWKLFRSLAGQADHFHLPGTGHHHHHHHGHGHDHHHHHDHDHADHYHDEHGHSHPLPADGKRPIGSWGLIVLGISGGIIPCVDAIAMFGLAVEMRRVWLALPLLLAFSAGLAGVLIAIGLAVVWAKGLAQARFGDHPRFRQVFRALPVVSALLITCLGIWLCRDIVQGAAAPPPVPAAASQP